MTDSISEGGGLPNPSFLWACPIQEKIARVIFEVQLQGRSRKQLFVKHRQTLSSIVSTSPPAATTLRTLLELLFWPT
ncbi:hypothetical protein WG66_002342 [Moniliophthora roreri]|nr:hypothetical protein WG66_002342 [Moniliophthora roreri]